jgi:polyribonucleotide nucleotidyltransferase
MKHITSSIELGGKTLTLETGVLAGQASAAVTARLGDTMVLATVVAARKESSLDYFPLQVEYVERLYAGGRIKGSRWVKREGRPTDEATLTGRLIDRSIRPLFPKEFKNDVQVVVTLLSVDGENEPDVLSILAVSAALAISPVPWNGPISAVRMGHISDQDGNHEFIMNPSAAQRAMSDLDLVVTQSNEKTLMLEAGAKQLEDGLVHEAIVRAHDENKRMIAFLEAFAREAGTTKLPVPSDATLKEYTIRIEKSYKSQIDDLIAKRVSSDGSSSDQEQLLDSIYSDWKTQNPEEQIDKKLIAKAFEKVFFKIIRSNILQKHKRPDGRALDEVRAISTSTDVLPRTHGSAVFQRGQTQVLSIATLGSMRLEQLIESAEGEEKKRYMHHYYFPPYSVGEVGRIGSLSRREIGHGALAERALEPVIPGEDVFPYAIRVVSETLSSNGSTSMASTCGSTMALMSAGVPILAPVAGIAMGRVQEGDEYVLLTDILGLEDFSGDMDFKVAGTTTGITAIQLDVKDAGLSLDQIKEVFDRAKKARLSILDIMLAVLPHSRDRVSQYAPKVSQVKVPVEKIGEVIGPGGRVIKNIIATTGADVDVDDDGNVNITGVQQDQVDQAVAWIQGLVREVAVGEVFDNGIVKRILPFGAFIEILPGKEGMVHVSQMSTQFVNDPHEVVQIGDTVKVRVMEIDQQKRINLSMLFGDDANKSTDRSDRGGERGDYHRGRQRQPRDDFRKNDSHPLSRQFKREHGGPNRGYTKKVRY